MNAYTLVFLIGACAGVTIPWAVALVMVRPWLSRLLDEENGVLPRLIRVVGEVADQLEILEARLEIIETNRLAAEEQKTIDELLG